MDTVIRFKKENGDYSGGYIISCERNAIVKCLFQEIWDVIYDQLDSETEGLLDQIEKRWNEAEIISIEDNQFDQMMEALKNRERFTLVET